jgi:hypothetical protein
MPENEHLQDIKLFFSTVYENRNCFMDCIFEPLRDRSIIMNVGVGPDAMGWVLQTLPQMGGFLDPEKHHG